MELQVGDVIYQESYGKIVNIFTIERVTKTLAISGKGVRFAREYSQHKWIQKIGKRMS